jgi:hypothetical protein
MVASKNNATGNRGGEVNRKLLDEIQLALLKGRTWRYLRYVHFRDAIARIANEVETVCVCGAGHGLAELAVAVEFPFLRFTLTDIIAKGYPNYHRTMDLCWRNGVTNMAFSIWDVLRPTERRFDLVASTEMLEHVPDAPRAARNMRDAATRYVYCLVPYADDRTNRNERRRAMVWKENEHFVCGYDAKSLESMFGEAEFVEPTYRHESGLAVRRTLSATSDEDIARNAEGLKRDALADLVGGSGSDSPNDAHLGIKILARANAPRPEKPIIPPKMDLDALVERYFGANADRTQAPGADVAMAAAS